MYKVYGKPSCPYCDMAKRLLDNLNEKYIYVDLMEDPGALAMIKGQGFKTVPQIWDEGIHVGGYNELAVYVNTKEKSETSDID